jgi:hypothetical protein
MKPMICLLCLLTLVACGKNGGNSSEPPERQEERVFVNAGGNGPEFSTVSLSLPATISGNSVVFSLSGNQFEPGIRHACMLSVKQNETLYYQLTGNELRMDFPGLGKIALNRISGRASDVTGSWLWKGRKNGINHMLRLTFLKTRVVMNKDCES